MKFRIVGHSPTAAKQARPHRKRIRVKRTRYLQAELHSEAKLFDAGVDLLSTDSAAQDEGEISLGAERKFLDLLAKIRRKDQSLYEPSAVARDNSSSSSSGSDQEEAPDRSANRHHRPAFLKDVLARQVSLCCCRVFVAAFAQHYDLLH